MTERKRPIHDRRHSTLDDENPDVTIARIQQKYDFLERRAAVIHELFERDPYSIDAIALTMIAFSATAGARFPGGSAFGRDRRQFRQLLTTYCPTFVNRVSIPELLLASRSRFPMLAIESKLGPHFPVRLDYTPEKDPLVPDFNNWLAANKVALPPELLEYDYAGCIFKKYRNAVVHSLQVAGGREANYFVGETSNSPIFYSRHTKPYGILIYTPDQFADAVEEMRFGALPTYLHTLLCEAIANLRKWAVSAKNDIFATADEIEHYEWLDGKMPRRKR